MAITIDCEDIKDGLVEVENATKKLKHLLNYESKGLPKKFLEDLEEIYETLNYGHELANAQLIELEDEND